MVDRTPATRLFPTGSPAQGGGRNPSQNGIPGTGLPFVSLLGIRGTVLVPTLTIISEPELVLSMYNIVIHHKSRP